MATALARLDRAGGVDRATEKQQLFSDGGFTGVRVGNNGKGAPAGDFNGKRHERTSSTFEYDDGRRVLNFIGQTDKARGDALSLNMDRHRPVEAQRRFARRVVLHFD